MSPLSLFRRFSSSLDLLCRLGSFRTFSLFAELIGCFAADDFVSISLFSPVEMNGISLARTYFDQNVQRNLFFFLKRIKKVFCRKPTQNLGKLGDVLRRYVRIFGQRLQMLPGSGADNKGIDQ